jgi:16S rRNA (adenine1518-N6/adenine1519-N6)-dimethyltransferase
MIDNFKPSKKYGQIFLTNIQISEKIVTELDPKSSDIVLEIGAGLGSLTQILVKKSLSCLIVLETDLRCVEILTEKYFNDLNIKQISILEFKFDDLFNEYEKKVKVIGNIPYHITSAIIFKLIENSDYISRIVLMVQKEVANRISAKTNCKDYGIFSIMIQSKADVKLLFDVERNNFYPVPNVDSAVIRLDFSQKTNDIIDYNFFSKIVHECFKTRRKMLHNSLKRIINENQIARIESVPLSLRPEELSIQDFKNLSNELSRMQ